MDPRVRSSSVGYDPQSCVLVVATAAGTLSRWRVSGEAIEPLGDSEFGAGIYAVELVTTADAGPSAVVATTSGSFVTVDALTGAVLAPTEDAFFGGAGAASHGPRRAVRPGRRGCRGLGSDTRPTDRAARTTSPAPRRWRSCRAPIRRPAWRSPARRPATCRRGRSIPVRSRSARRGPASTLDRSSASPPTAGQSSASTSVGNSSRGTSPDGGRRPAHPGARRSARQRCSPSPRRETSPPATAAASSRSPMPPDHHTSSPGPRLPSPVSRGRRRTPSSWARPTGGAHDRPDGRTNARSTG